jgi:uncharacterized peroxidase-related enzyme
MQHDARRSPRLAPLPPTSVPDLQFEFEAARKRLGFVPNSIAIMARCPKIVKGYQQLAAAIFDPHSTVPLSLKQLIGHVASRSAGCQYCVAHTGGVAVKAGLEQRKFDAIWEYQSSPLFTPAERAALDVAVAAGCVPNAVSDEMFLELCKHWSKEQIVEIVGVIAMFGFLNRWNDTMATPIEDEPALFGERHLAKQGWRIGKHAR